MPERLMNHDPCCSWWSQIDSQPVPERSTSQSSRSTLNDATGVSPLTPEIVRPCRVWQTETDYLCTPPSIHRDDDDDEEDDGEEDDDDNDNGNDEVAPAPPTRPFP